MARSDFVLAFLSGGLAMNYSFPFSSGYGLPGVLSASVAKTYPALGWADGWSIFYERHEPSQEELRCQSAVGRRAYQKHLATAE